MPWADKTINDNALKLKKLIFFEFNTKSTSEILLCTQREMIQRLENELRSRGLIRKKVDFLKSTIFPLVIGKYFAETNEIWIVEGIGETNSILMHELLHSIQICNKHRESICDYLTYKLSNDQNSIDEFTLRDWIEIERIYGINAIKKRFLTIGDCEDF